MPTLVYSREEMEAVVRQRYPAKDPEALERMLRSLPLNQRFTTLRSIHNLSQAEMAEAIGMKRNAVSNWEAEMDDSRRTVPQPETRARLGYAFHLPPSVFAEDEPEIPLD